MGMLYQKSIAGHLRDCASLHPGGQCNCETLLAGGGRDNKDDDELDDAYREAFDPDWGS